MSASYYWCVVLAFVCCCGTRPRAVPLDQGSKPQRTVPRNPAKFDELSERAREIAREIAELRGWNAKLDVALELANVDRMLAAVRADEQLQAPPSVQRAETDFLVAFGWVPTEFDFERGVTEHFGRNLLGLYSTAERRILIAAQPHKGAVESALRHELVHAFQDKYFQIGKRVRWRNDQGDFISAVHALAEGEATCISLQLEDPRHRGCLDLNVDEFEDRRLRQDSAVIPRVVEYSLVSPYIDGVRFVRQLLRRGGWPSVDRAWHGELQATCNLLHPDRSPAEPHAIVQLPTPMRTFGSCQSVYVDILGEQGLAGILFDQMDAATARQAASTWTGDRAAVWQCEKVCAQAWHIRLAEVNHAMTIASAIFPSPSQGTLGLNGRKGCHKKTDDGVFGLAVSGRDIAITGVRSCDGRTPKRASVSCETAAAWAGQLVAQ